jgi:hypothetical protein
MIKKRLARNFESPAPMTPKRNNMNPITMNPTGKIIISQVSG